MSYHKSIIGLLILLLGLSAPLAWAATPQAKGLETTDWGWVTGGVYDAGTGAPVAGATVTVQYQGAFAETGRTVARTEKSGVYRCEAILGHKTNKIDFGRLMNTGLIGLMAGGANKKTKRVDVTQVNLRIAKAGYQTFEGPVTCRAISGEQFTLYLYPIHLSPAGCPESSAIVQGWHPVRIKDIIAEPAVVAPNDTTTLKVWVACPPLDKPGDLRVEVQAESFGKTRLKWEKTEVNPGEYLFSGSVKINRKAKAQAEAVTATALAPDNLGSAERWIVRLYVAKTPEERTVAELREKAINRVLADDNVEAARLFKAICALPQATRWDWAILASISLQLHDYDTALEARRQVMILTPAKEIKPSLAGYANALLLAQDYQRILTELLPKLEAVKEKDRPKEVPIEVMLAVGTAYLETGQLEAAGKIGENLHRWSGGTLSQINQFHRSLRLAQVEKAVETNPELATNWADYGRALMDLGRWEEAGEKLEKALALEPQMPAVQWDLGYARLQIRGGPAPGEEDFERALAEAEQAVATKPEDKKQKQTKDFYAWHRLGLLLYRKAVQQQQAGDPEAPATFVRSREMLLEALNCGRTGSEDRQGNYSFTLGYLSPQIISICGFAYPEADADFRLLRGLEVLSEQPEDYLTNYNIAVALIDLGQWDLAGEALAKTRQLQPDFLEAKYASALVARQEGDFDEALTLLQAVVAANPRQAQAQQALAELYTEQGDMAAAAACLAARAKYTGQH